MCVCSVSLCVISANCRHPPLATDLGHVTPQLQLTAADAGCRYGETDTVMCVVINVVTGVQCKLCSDAP